LGWNLDVHIDFKLEYAHDDSIMKSLKSILIDSGVEFLVRYSKLELVLVNSKLEFTVELKIPTSLVKMCPIMEIQLFDLLLPKSIEPKFLSSLINSYINFPMLVIRFFGLGNFSVEAS
jgi:hypothetical protein